MNTSKKHRIVNLSQTLDSLNPFRGPEMEREIFCQDAALNEHQILAIQSPPNAKGMVTVQLVGGRTIQLKQSAHVKMEIKS